MTDTTEIYICLNGEERGPFDSAKIDRMLQEGSVRLNDKAWRPGLQDWTTLELALRPPAAAKEAEAPSEPATPKQKAFLSYMNIAFSPGLSKEKAALLVNDAMENPSDPKRLAKWPDERLRLHPELYAADLQAKKENRPATFYERVLAEGAECFHDVSKAHCQVLVGFLDVKFPNWDARDSDAAWDYFFPALAEKFPQLVNKAWKGRLQYSQGPRIAAELKQTAPTREAALRPRGPLISARVVTAVVLLAAAGAIGLYLKGHPGAWQKAAEHAKAAATSVTAATAPATPHPAPAPGSTPAPLKITAKTEGTKTEPAAGMSAPKEGAGEVAMNTSPAGAPPEAGMGSMAGSMTPAPAAESGAPPTLFTPPPPAASLPGASNAPATPVPAIAPPPATGGPRTAAKITTPLAIKTAYGVVTIAPGTTLKIISREGAVVRLNYMNQMISVPVSATDVGE